MTHEFKDLKPKEVLSFSEILIGKHYRAPQGRRGGDQVFRSLVYRGNRQEGKGAVCSAYLHQHRVGGVRVGHYFA